MLKGPSLDKTTRTNQIARPPSVHDWWRPEPSCAEPKRVSSLSCSLRYAGSRIETSHDHSGEKAQACLEIMGDFIDDAIGLYQTTTAETWE